MGKTWWIRFSVLMVVFVISALSIVPSFTKTDLSKTAYPFQQKLNLGLDLQGGLYLVLGIDFEKFYVDKLEQVGASLRETLLKEGVSFSELRVVKEGNPADDPHLVVKADAATLTKLKSTLAKDFPNLRIAVDQVGVLEIGLSADYRNQEIETVLNQSIETVRNRIDEFGVSEPSISSQGNSRIVVELPGIKEVERAKDLIGRTAKLEFKIVDPSMSPAQLQEKITRVEKEQNIQFNGEEGNFSEFVKKLNEALSKEIPAGTEIAFEKIKGRGVNPEEGQARIPHLLFQKVDVSGNDLSDAQVAFNPEDNSPLVSFSFGPAGATRFETLTSANIRKQLAIVLDGIVHSAPMIQSKIGARGQITLGQGSYEERLKEAKDLAIVLRAGALPATLKFMEQRVVGPSLGADSIKQGGLATVIGILAVFAFTLFYYRFSGVIAVISLILNVVMVLALLVALEATLTLPGIAGIALTVGIAVDSNVVIYERIREELRNTRSIYAAVEAGFQKAFRTIVDSNVTNAAAAVILMLYGTGPVRGFAVSLLVGIVTTLFTAVFVCKVLFELYLHRLEKKRIKTLSI